MHAQLTFPERAPPASLLSSQCLGLIHQDPAHARRRCVSRLIYCVKCLLFPPAVDIISLIFVAQRNELISSVRLISVVAFSFKLPGFPLLSTFLLFFLSSFHFCSSSRFLVAIQSGSITTCIFYCSLPSSRRACQPLSSSLSLPLHRALLYATMQLMFVATTRLVLQVC